MMISVALWILHLYRYDSILRKAGSNCPKDWISREEEFVFQEDKKNIYVVAADKSE
jgi:hypothetical protein